MFVSKLKRKNHSERRGDIYGGFACNYLAHTESPVYLSFPGVVGLGHLRVSAGEESSLESVAALHDFAKMVSIFLKSTQIDQSLQSSFSGTRGDIPDLFFPTIRARSTLFRKVGVGSYRSEISDFSAKRTLCSGGQKSLVRTYGRLSK